MAMDAAEIVNAESILAEFSDLEDPRSTVNRVHVLGDIVVISIMAVIAGAEAPKAIAAGWGGGRRFLLRKRSRQPTAVRTKPSTSLPVPKRSRSARPKTPTLVHWRRSGETPSFVRASGTTTSASPA